MMELALLLISVPAFLIVVLLFSLYILPRYSGRVPETKAPVVDKESSSQD